MTSYTARHRKKPASHTARNAGLAAVTIGAVIGVGSPAHAHGAANIPSPTPTSSPTAMAPTPSLPQTSPGDVHGARQKIVHDALSGLGGSYVWGGKTFGAWDCSGFVSWVYAQSGIHLDAYTYTMKDQLLQTQNPQPGDIVFTNNYAHVGIYLGNGQMVSALNPTQGTIITPVDGGGMMSVDGYYKAPGL